MDPWRIENFLVAGVDEQNWLELGEGQNPSNKTKNKI